jgi:predicted patatin/cPLA2 family phospholipase
MFDVKKIKLKKQEGKKLICLVMNNNEDNKQVFGMMPLNLKKWKKEYTSLYEALVKQQSNYLLYVAYITDQNNTLNVADEDIIFKDEININ